jgi:hypothetical protein
MSNTAKYATAAALSIVLLGAAAAPVAAAAPQDHMQSYPADQETRHGRRVYCIVQEVSGAKSRVRTCRTKDQWARRGARVHHLELEASCPPNGKLS